MRESQHEVSFGHVGLRRGRCNWRRRTTTSSTFCCRTWLALVGSFVRTTAWWRSILIRVCVRATDLAVGAEVRGKWAHHYWPFHYGISHHQHKKPDSRCSLVRRAIRKGNYAVFVCFARDGIVRTCAAVRSHPMAACSRFLCLNFGRALARWPLPRYTLRRCWSLRRGW